MLEEYKLQMLKKHIEDNREKLYSIFTESWNINSAGEISQLKDFMLKDGCGIKYINQELSKLKHKCISIKLNAVYSHGSPKVKFQFRDEKILRELADVLVVLRINDLKHIDSETIYSSSFLSQWKLNYQDNKNPGQTYLYDYTKEFDMPIWVGKKNKFGVKRHFCDRTKSLNFFYLEDRQYSKRPNGQPRLNFADLLLDFLILDYGVEFDHKLWTNKSHLSSSWDKLMHDLIVTIGQKKISGTNGKSCKLVEYKISADPFFYCIDNSETVKDSLNENSENRFQSILIIDVNFNRNLKLQRLNLV